LQDAVLHSKGLRELWRAAWSVTSRSAYLEERLGTPLLRLLLDPGLLVDGTSPLSRVELGQTSGTRFIRT